MLIPLICEESLNEKVGLASKYETYIHFRNQVLEINL